MHPLKLVSSIGTLGFLLTLCELIKFPLVVHPTPFVGFSSVVR